MTFCIAIGKDIVVSTCPLRKGACMWQHQKTQHCKYTAEDITTEEFCARVGKPIPDPEVQSALFAELRRRLTP